MWETLPFSTSPIRPLKMSGSFTRTARVLLFTYVTHPCLSYEHGRLNLPRGRSAGRDVQSISLLVFAVLEGVLHLLHTGSCMSLETRSFDQC